MISVDLSERVSGVELAVLIAYLEEIVRAVDARDRRFIPELLSEPLGTHLPREVREELSTFATQSANGFRAPIRFLRFRFRMLQLAAGDGPFEDPQLELDLGRGAGWRPYRDDPDQFDDEMV